MKVRKQDFDDDAGEKRGTTERPLEILLVEDDVGDVELTKDAMAESDIINHINVVRDGVGAINYLRKNGRYGSAKRPDLILLDLNLPKKDGREVLSELKADENLKMIPVVVLSTSEAKEDIVTAYRLGCNCYIAKPIGLNRFNSMIKALNYFWCAVVKIPPKIEYETG